MLLTGSTDKIQIVLGATAATNELQFITSFNETTSASITPSKYTAVTTGITPADFVPSPAPGAQRSLRWACIFNCDSVSSTVTIRSSFSGGATTRIAFLTTLQVNEYIQYTYSTGWKVFDVNGALKITNGIITSTNQIIPELNSTTGLTQSLSLGTSPYCVYLGKATNAHKNIGVSVNLVTTLVGSAPVVEVAIYKGYPTIGTAPTITRCGYSDCSAFFLRNANTPLGIYIPVDGIAAGDDLWAVFWSGGTVTTNPALRCLESTTDIVGAGFFLSSATLTRPSSTPTLSTTIQNNTKPIRVGWQGD